MTLSDFVAKVENEGGLYEAVVGYGLSHHDIDEDENPEVYEVFSLYVERAEILDLLEGKLTDLLEEYYE